MSYMHIDNLYKYPKILLFKQVYALEKIHGTSAHISWKEGKVGYFSGGEKHERFKGLFDDEDLTKLFQEHFPDCDVILFGEAYGGKQQGMSHTYGKELKFIVFDVKVGDYWLDVPNADDVAKKAGLEFVSYKILSTDIEELNKARLVPSVQAIRNGIEEPKMKEGIVLKPLFEMKGNDGKRIICKHKNDEFMETKTPREVDPEKLKVLEEANEVAGEWVTPMRLTHVLDKLPDCKDIKQTGIVIKAMMEDVKREGENEIKWSKDVERAIGKMAAKLYKDSLKGDFK